MASVLFPDASKFTRFKQDFLMDLQSMFDHLVDITEPICQRIDSNLASMSMMIKHHIAPILREFVHISLLILTSV